MTNWAKEAVSELFISEIFKTGDEALKILGTDLPLLTKLFDLQILDGL